MAAVAKANVVEIVPAQAGFLGVRPPAELIAGEPIAPGDCCYVKATDGRAYRCLGATGAATDRCRGQAQEQASAGGPVHLVHGLTFTYGAGLTPGTDFFLSAAVPGGLDTAAPYAGAAPVGYALNATDVKFFEPN